MFNLNSVSLLIYSLILLTGGLIGYFKSSSLISLIAATATSLIIILSIWLSYQGFTWGKFLAWIPLIALTLFFGYRFYKTGQWMPGGIMLIASLFTLLLQLILTITRVSLR